MSQISQFINVETFLESLTTDDATAVGVDSAGNIDLDGGTNINTTGDATNNRVIVNLDNAITLTTVNATAFDTNVAAAGITLSGTSLLADGTDTDIDINITAKGTGQVIIDDLQLTTDLAIAYGGTNASSMTNTYGVNYFDGTSIVTTLVGTANQVLTSNGAGVAPTFQANAGIDTTYHTDGGDATESGNAVTIAGGTNITTAGAGATVTVNLDDSISVTSIYADTFDTGIVAAGLTLSGTSLLADGTDANIDINITAKGTGQVIIDDLNVSGLTAGTVRSSAAGDISSLADGTDGMLLISKTGDVPIWATLTDGNNITSTEGANSISIAVTGTTEHGVQVGSAAGALTSLAVGTDGQVLLGSSAVDPVFATLSSTGTIAFTPGAGTLALNCRAATDALTGVVELATDAESIAGGAGSVAIIPTSLKAKLGAQTSHGLPYGAGTDTAIAWTTEPSDGQFLIGDAANIPQLGTITAGAGISVTNAAHSITIAYIGGGVGWNVVTDAAANMVINAGYIANRGTLVTLTLPDTATVGSTIKVTGIGAGGWKVAQNAGETIYFGTGSTTGGAGGSLASTQTRDSIELVCVVADTDWNVLSSVGNFTLV